MKPKYELKYGYSGEVYAREHSRALTGRTLLPAWKIFIGATVAFIALSWLLCLAFFTWGDGVGMTIFILIAAAAVGGMMWIGPLDEEFFVDDYEEIPNRTLCYSYDLSFSRRPKAMSGSRAHDVLEAALKSEIYSTKAEEIIEAGIVAMDGIDGLGRREAISIALSPHLYKIEKQMSEDQDIKTETAREHVEMLLGKEPA